MARPIGKIKSTLRDVLTPPRYEALKRLVVYGPGDLLDRILGRREDLVPPRRLDFVGGHRFKAIGDEYQRYFVDLGGLQPHHQVLDIGCGIGRMARPLTAYLDDQGAYEGIDVDARGIDWCKRNISPRFPNFRFQRLDVRNQRYNPRGSILASQLRLPFDDGRFDLVFLTSVFTHMLPYDVARYFAEMARVLRPGGTCLITWFLWNTEAARLTEQGRARIRFEHDFGSFRATDPQVPEDAVSLPEAQVLELYRENGLEVVPPIHYGWWTGRSPHLSYQDIVIARRP